MKAVQSVRQDPDGRAGRRKRRSASAAILSLLLAAGCVAPATGGGGGEGGATAPPTEGSHVPSVVFPEGVEAPDPAVEGEIIEAVARLWSSDFAVYTEAGKSLLSLGEQAIPYLGYYGDVKKELWPGQEMPIARCILDPIVQTVPPERLSGYLRSPYRQVRASAAMSCGERRERSQVPLLLDLLEDPEPMVRAAANAALRMISNRFFDFRPDGPAHLRTAAIARWRRHFGVEESPPSGPVRAGGGG